MVSKMQQKLHTKLCIHFLWTFGNWGSRESVVLQASLAQRGFSFVLFGIGKTVGYYYVSLVYYVWHFSSSLPAFSIPLYGCGMGEC